MNPLKFKIWNIKDQKFMSDNEVRSYRLAVAPNGQVYSGAYDCIVDNYEAFLSTGKFDKNGREVLNGDLVLSKTGIIKVEWNEHCTGFWPYTETGDYMYDGSYDNLEVLNIPKHREYIFKNAAQISDESTEVLVIMSDIGSCHFHPPSKTATIKIDKKTIGLENATFETLIERSDERIIGDKVMAFLEIIPADAKITGDLVYESL